jgi:arylsulfatase A-like enzyme
MLENAIVALVADHGEGLWDHRTTLPPERWSELPPKFFFFSGHGYTLFQEAIHTPFVLWGRGVPKGVRVREPIENIDLFPTPLQLAGIAPAGRLDGHSLVGLMNGREEEWRTLVFSFVRQNACVQDRESGYKLIEPTEFGRRKCMRTEHYHLPSDPLEREDLAARHPEEVERLLALLDEWKRRHPISSAERGSRSEAQVQRMLALGYTDEHTPDLEGKEGTPSDEEQ